MSGADAVASRAEELRDAFDSSFSRTPPASGEVIEDLLTLQAGSHPYALRLRDCGGIGADRRVTPLPTRVPELRGLTSFRGRLVPVYDLAALAGLPPCPSARWLAWTSSDEPVALAFERFDGHARARPGDLSLEPSPDAFVEGIARLRDGARGLLRMAAILAAIERRVGAVRPGG